MTIIQEIDLSPKLSPERLDALEHTQINYWDCYRLARSKKFPWSCEAV